MERKGESAKYLPPALNHEAWVLDDYGTWARVYYEGAYRYFWRPVHVGIGWAPFTVGRWMLWYGDHCWIPAERFGYVTHHYGNWVLVKGIWHWAPPVVRARISLGPPFFNIGFAWYPGRVAWIHSGVHIGWVPLAPFEPYYSHRRWGRRSVVVKNVKTMNINIGINKYRYSNRAVIIYRDNLHRVKNYKRVRIKPTNNATLITKHRTAPVVGNRIISNYTKNELSRPKTRGRAQVVSQRNTKNKNIEHPKGRGIKPAHKPHRIVTERIHHNKLQEKLSSGVSAKPVRKITKNIGHGNPVKGARIGKLKVKGRLVPPDRVTRPVSEVKFREKELRRAEIRRAQPKVRTVGRTR